MGLFGKKDKKIMLTFYSISEVTKKGSFSTESVLRYDKFPLFEDHNEAKVFCKMMKQNGIDTTPFGMKFEQEGIRNNKYEGLIFIGKKEDNLDYKCWSCKELFSSQKVKWKPRTFTNESVIVGEKQDELRKIVENLAESTGETLDTEHQSSPNQIFNGNEYENRGNCPKCNSEITCFWFGVKSLEKNHSSILQQKSSQCPTCENMMRNEFQVWYSITLKGNNDEEPTEYLVTICPKCKDEVTFPYEYDLNKGIIE